MHEKQKVSEARFFLSQLSAFRDSSPEFTYVLSAFLSSARSALQYALEEAKTKPGGQLWYDSHLQNDPVLKFFKEKRDLSIHVAPVVPRRIVTMESTVYVSVTDSVSITVRKADGTVIEEIESEPRPTKPTPPAVSTATTVYYFEEWGRNDDVEVIAERYLAVVEHIVSEGMQRGFITG